MKITSIFTDEELALIDSGKYTPGRAALDAKLDLAMALEREACAKVCESMRAYVDRHNAVIQSSATDCAAAIRARGQA
jgi:hypothetical protein